MSSLKEGLQDSPAAAAADPAAATNLAAAAAAAARDAAVPAGPSGSPSAAAGANPGKGSFSSSSGRHNSMSGGSDVSCWLLFEVEDTGVGITRDGLATLFREYVQGTEDEMCKPRTRGGTGLGLSICSKQVGC
jgi:signal transduction histidine kinase